MGSEVVDVETVASTMKVVLFWAVGILIPIIGLQAEEVIDDMVILEAPTRFTRESVLEDDLLKVEDEDEDAGSSREGKQFFWGLGPMFPNGFIMQRGSGWWGVPFMVPQAPMQQMNNCYTSKGYAGTCRTLNQCFTLIYSLPKNLPSWALGTKDQCTMHYAQADRMGYQSQMGVCCTNTQQRTAMPQYPGGFGGGLGGLYPGGTQGLYPGMGGGFGAPGFGVP